MGSSVEELGSPYHQNQSEPSAARTCSMAFSRFPGSQDADRTLLRVMSRSDQARFLAWSPIHMWKFESIHDPGKSRLSSPRGTLFPRTLEGVVVSIHISFSSRL